MRKYITLFFSVLPFLFACNFGGVPDGIIKPDKMVDLLTEVHLADGSLINLMQTPDTLYKYGTNKYVALFKKFHTDSVQFRKSFKYYTTKPEQMADIYDKILKKLQAKNDSVTKALSIQNTKARNTKPALPITPSGKVAPTAPAAMPGGRPNKLPPSKILNRFRARKDSFKKAHLKNTHALPAK